MDDDKIHSGEQPYAAGGEPAEEQSKSTISADLIRGHINTIILRTLDERDKYGYEIINEIEAKSHGQYTIKQPTLYSALKRLETQGYIKAYWKTDEVSSGGRRKYFTLTELGREFSEKNQSEWEYSRTVIDSLISDRSFDFSQPAPTPVDFNILKKSVTRVYTGNGKSESESYEESPAADSRTYDALNDATLKDEYSGQSVHDIYVEKVPDKIVAEEKSEHDEYVQTSAAVEVQPAEETHEQVQPEPEQYAPPVQEYHQPEPEHYAPPVEEYHQPEPEHYAPPVQEYRQPEPEHYAPPVEEYRQPEPEHYAPPVEEYHQPEPEQYAPPVEEYHQPEPEHYASPVQEGYSENAGQIDEKQSEYEQAMEDERTEEERRRMHESFLRLMDQTDEAEKGTVPNFDSIDTEKLIYTNKPETERDYKKLVDNIYNKTLKNGEKDYGYPDRQAGYETAPAAQPAAEVRKQSIASPRPADPVFEKAKADGLKINTSSGSSVRVKGAKGTTYNKGGTMFASSIVVGLIMLLEFIVCISVMGVMNVDIMYPMTILIIAVAQLAVFGCIFAAGFGRSVVRPTKHKYITLCVILNVIAILIICLVSFLLDINFTSAADVAAKLIIPIIISLNISIFGVSYYFICR